MGQTVTTSSDKQDITIATWISEVLPGVNNDGTELEIEKATNSPDKEEVTLLSIQIGDLETLGISASLS